MNTVLSLIQARVLGSMRSEKGVVGFEYLLIIGGVSVTAIGAIGLGAPNLTSGVLAATCNAIIGVLPITC